MKSFTDLNQSKMLAEFLSVESADLYYLAKDDRGIEFFSNPSVKDGVCEDIDVPCWSLAALLDIIPMVRIDNFFDFDVSSMKWNCMAFPENYQSIETDNYDNPVDACVDMIVRLKKHNLI